MNSDYRLAGLRLGDLVAAKRREYGRALEKAADMVATLYPDGVQPEQYREFFSVFRVCEKLSRIAAGDEGDESGWLDVAGHALVEVVDGRKEKVPVPRSELHPTGVQDGSVSSSLGLPGPDRSSGRAPG